MSTTAGRFIAALAITNAVAFPALSTDVRTNTTDEMRRQLRIMPLKSTYSSARQRKEQKRLDKRDDGQVRS